jgi:hypothetical protein
MKKEDRATYDELKLKARLDDYWFDPEKTDKEKGACLAMSFKKIDDTYKGIHWNWAWYISLYQNVFGNVSSAKHTLGMIRYGTANVATQPLSINVISQCVDTVIAMVVRNKISVKFATDGATDTLQQRADKLSRFVSGVYYANKVYDKAADTARNACVFGTGVWHVYPDFRANQVKVIPIAPDELRVRAIDGMYKQPTEIMRTRPVSRLEMQIRFPKKSVALQNVASVRLNVGQDTEDCIEAVEAWKAPSYEGADDGRHMLTCGDVVLVDEPWKWGIPFVFIRWKDQPKDFWGTGIPFDLIPIQLKIIEFINNISRAISHFSMPYMLIPKDSKPSREAFNNLLARVITYQGGTPPTIQAPQNIVNQSAYDFVFRLKAEAFDTIGMSEMQAHGEQQGVESGVARRIMIDVQNGRFATFSNEWESGHIALSQMIIDCGDRLYGKKSLRQGRHE